MAGELILDRDPPGTNLSIKIKMKEKRNADNVL
jgi:hypothetical protein